MRGTSKENWRRKRKGILEHENGRDRNEPHGLRTQTTDLTIYDALVLTSVVFLTRQMKRELSN